MKEILFAKMLREMIYVRQEKNIPTSTDWIAKDNEFSFLSGIFPKWRLIKWFVLWTVPKRQRHHLQHTKDCRESSSLCLVFGANELTREGNILFGETAAKTLDEE